MKMHIELKSRDVGEASTKLMRGLGARQEDEIGAKWLLPLTMDLAVKDDRDHVYPVLDRLLTLGLRPMRWQLRQYVLSGSTSAAKSKVNAAPHRHVPAEHGQADPRLTEPHNHHTRTNALSARKNDPMSMLEIRRLRSKLNSLEAKVKANASSSAPAAAPGRRAALSAAVDISDSEDDFQLVMDALDNGTLADNEVAALNPDGVESVDLIKFVKFCQKNKNILIVESDNAEDPHHLITKAALMRVRAAAENGEDDGEG